MHRVDNVLAVERALPEESKLALAHFVKENSRWQGAHWADILDELDNLDAYVGDVETTWEAVHQRVEPRKLWAIRLVALTLNYAYQTWPTDDLVVATVARIP